MDKPLNFPVMSAGDQIVLSIEADRLRELSRAAVLVHQHGVIKTNCVLKAGDVDLETIGLRKSKDSVVNMNLLRQGYGL